MAVAFERKPLEQEASGPFDRIVPLSIFYADTHGLLFSVHSSIYLNFLLPSHTRAHRSIFSVYRPIRIPFFFPALHWLELPLARCAVLNIA